jgi:hypothetical protein
LGGRTRRAGGGRKRVTEKDPQVVGEVERIVSDNTFGNPERPLSYTTKSLKKIEAELKARGHPVICTNLILNCSVI